MFQCPMCSRLLKSRSGLSGHLQFKHATKLRALEAAPEQAGPAPSKALEAASDFGLPYHALDAIECVVYMIETDVSRLVSEADLQEVILWEIVTDVEYLQAAIKAQNERHDKVMEVLTQGMAKLTADLDVLARGIAQLNDKIETLVANAHPPGFCRQRSCVANCDSQLKELKADTEKQIDYRITVEKLKRIGFS